MASSREKGAAIPVDRAVRITGANVHVTIECVGKWYIAVSSPQKREFKRRKAQHLTALHIRLEKASHLLTEKQAESLSRGRFVAFLLVFLDQRSIDELLHHVS